MTARNRRYAAELLAEYQVAGLAVLEISVVLTLRALVVTYPALFRTPRPNDRAELTSARLLLDDCTHLLESIDGHWKQAAIHLPDGHPAKDRTDEDDPF